VPVVSDPGKRTYRKTQPRSATAAPKQDQSLASGRNRQQKRPQYRAEDVFGEMYAKHGNIWEDTQELYSPKEAS
jgi:hypothetical protein